MTRTMSRSAMSQATLSRALALQAEKSRAETSRFGRGLAAPSGVMLGVACALGHAGTALAQTSVLGRLSSTAPGFTTLVEPALAPDYQRDHNIGVLDEVHPDYDAVGAAIGSFNFKPNVTLGVVGDSNVFVTDVARKADVSAVLKPGFSLASDWSRHALQLQGNADLRQYSTQTVANQNAWDLYPSGEMNLGRFFVLHAEGRVGRYGESPFSSDQNPEAQVLSRFFRTGELLKGTYTRGRVRLTAAYDHSAYSYSQLRFPDGRTGDQRYRNRTIDRVSGQVELALSPSLALYSAVSTDKITYPVLQSGGVSQTSTGQQILAGVSFDLAGVMRGMIGAGFTHRGYEAASQPNVNAFSAQARVDFFPFKLTTVTLTGQRLVQDSALGSAPYVDSRISAEVDQSLRENLMVIVGATAVDQSYIDSTASRSSKQVHATLRYQASRWLGFQLESIYRTSKTNSLSVGAGYTDLMTGLSVTVRR